MKKTDGTLKRLAAVALWITLALLSTQAPAKTLDDLFRAIKTEDIGTIKSMMATMGPDTVNENGDNLLMYALRERSYQAARVILTARPDVKTRNRFGETALMLAAFRGQADIARELIRRGSEINPPGWTPLAYAAFEGHGEVAQLLLESGANPNAKTANGLTPLMLAAENGHEKVVRILLRYGANPILINDEGHSAISLALRVGNTDIADILKAAAIRKR